MAEDNDIPGNNPPPPPPPPPPGDFAFRETSDADAGQLESGKPTVAASPTRVFLVLGLIGTVLLFLLYNIFFGGSKEAPPEPRPIQVSSDNGRDNTNIPPPVLESDTIPNPINITPPPIPVPEQPGEINQQEDNANNKALLDRLKSNMLIVNSAGGLFGNDSSQAESELSNNDPNLRFGNLVMRANTRAPRVLATHIGDLSRTIAQGRLIHATLESAINTDLPGPIRAIVSRDIYAEAGTEPLIPKGSRLIGQYNSSIMFGQSRIYVMWTRVLRPDGVDVALGSPLVDQIGQAGIGGIVDNKFRELFSRAVLASVFSIATAVGVDATGIDTETSTTSSVLGTQTSGDAAGQATVDALENLGDITTNFIQRFISVKPTITVDQGTPLFVFVNQDLVFPAEYTGAQQIP